MIYNFFTKKKIVNYKISLFHEKLLLEDACWEKNYNIVDHRFYTLIFLRNIVKQITTLIIAKKYPKLPQEFTKQENDYFLCENRKIMRETILNPSIIVDLTNKKTCVVNSNSKIYYDVERDSEFPEFIFFKGPRINFLNYESLSKLILNGISSVSLLNLTSTKKYCYNIKHLELPDGIMSEQEIYNFPNLCFLKLSKLNLYGRIFDYNLKLQRFIHNKLRCLEIRKTMGYYDSNKNLCPFPNLDTLKINTKFFGTIGGTILKVSIHKNIRFPSGLICVNNINKLIIEFIQYNNRSD